MSRFHSRLRNFPRPGFLVALIGFAALSAHAQVPDAPVLSAPANEASNLTTANFSWSTVSGATGYHLQLSKTYAFTAPVVNDSSLTTSTVAVGSLDLSTVYFWRVRARNGSGPGSWSTIFTFTSKVPLPAADTGGWIKLFRGSNTNDFFIANNGNTPPGRLLNAFPNSTYSITGDTIKVTGSPAGQLYFKQPFSHYKIRYQMRFPNATGSGNGGTGNCGMLLHVQAHDNPTMGFPRSVESQGDPTQGMGQLWPIGDVWVTVRARTVSGRMQYMPDSSEVDYGGANWNSRVVVGQPGWANPTYQSQLQDGWVTQEAHVYGSDSIIHLAGGVPRIKYRNPRVSSGGTPNNVSKFLARGLVSWQSEGTAVWYRNLEIKLMPGDSLYATSIAPRGRVENRSISDAPRLMMGKGSPTLELQKGPAGRSSTFDLRGRNLGRESVPASIPDETTTQENQP